MPSARANIIAKFIAHTEIGMTSLRDQSAGGGDESGHVSNSGSPAATREPNASTMIAKVTGQENNSALIIASWLALLKSDHSAEEPVG